MDWTWPQHFCHAAALGVACRGLGTLRTLLIGLVVYGGALLINEWNERTGWAQVGDTRFKVTAGGKRNAELEEKMAALLREGAS